MKPLFLSLILGVTATTSGLCQEAEKDQPEPAPTKPEPAEEVVETKPQKTLSEFKQTGISYDQALYSDLTLPDLTVNTNATVPIVTTNTLTTMEFEKVEVRGTVTPVIKKRTFGSFLQLFNPFAPSEYGGNDNAESSPGFERAFHDPVTDGPTTVLIGVDRKTKPSDTDK